MAFDEMDYKGEYLRIATEMGRIHPECEITTLDMVKLLIHENDTLRIALKIPTRKAALKQIEGEGANA
jgi:hypothetical protein